MRRLALLCLALAGIAFAGPACGKEDVEQQLRDARDEAQRKLDQAEEELRQARDRIRERVDEILGDLEQAIPEAPTTDPAGRSQGATEPTEIGRFMTGVLENVDRYWTTTLQANDLPAPRVRYVWVAPGTVAGTACGSPADDSAAFYCPTDDTIYVAQQFASDLFQGVARGFPGEEAGYGHAAGDFAVAYVIAHEYAHNVQQELGVFASFTGRQARPFELQADCMAGAWANSVYEQGLLEPGDLQEALDTALAIGDFELGSEQHHGTPTERRDALLAGYEGGDPSVCSRYVPA
ncbi:MAG TPA: neutral zinc metallopeptidase [Capillimicrobium sp.]|nr:neutral zinc metallopeptidase [Capillimicrobium sp.]